MTKTSQFETQTKALIDDLKSVCANYGLGNDGNEFKIITQIFLYKFLNDKFVFEIKQLDQTIAKAENWAEALKALKPDDYEMLMMLLGQHGLVVRAEQVGGLVSRTISLNVKTGEVRLKCSGQNQEIILWKG